MARAAGGVTRVLDRSVPGEAEGEFGVLGAVQPVPGAVSVFRDGKVLREGVKYLFRTDIVFEREEFDSKGLCGD